jgi:hypothetical protein
MSEKITITFEKAALQNLITGITYLEELLKQTDVSDDFAPDETTEVSAWDLITEQEAFMQIQEALNPPAMDFKNMSEDDYLAIINLCITLTENQEALKKIKDFEGQGSVWEYIEDTVKDLGRAANAQCNM